MNTMIKLKVLSDKIWWSETPLVQMHTQILKCVDIEHKHYCLVMLQLAHAQNEQYRSAQNPEERGGQEGTS